MFSKRNAYVSHFVLGGPQLSIDLKWVVGGCLILILVCSGTACGPSSLPTSDSETAKSALIQALAAWESGISIEDYRKANPRIIVSDELWESESELKAFAVMGDSQDEGGNALFQTRLNLTRLNHLGNTSTNREVVVEYLVGTAPRITIFRKYAD